MSEAVFTILVVCAGLLGAVVVDRLKRSREETTAPGEEALQHLSRLRGWRYVPRRVSGEHRGRAVRVLLQDPIWRDQSTPETRMEVELTHPNARALDGLTSWEGELDWERLCEHPSDTPDRIPVQALPAQVREDLGPTLHWMLETSARVVVIGGRLYADHPEVITDGHALAEIVEAVIEHSEQLDLILTTLPADFTR